MNAAPADSATPDKDLPFVAWYQSKGYRVQSTNPLHVGDLCPECQVGCLDYDGVLNLACNQCGYALSGGAGCT